MKFTLSWLREHLDTAAGVAEVVEAMTMAGLEVEHVIDPAARLAAFSAARIVSAARHPNADRLTKGTGWLEIMGAGRAFAQAAPKRFVVSFGGISTGADGTDAYVLGEINVSSVFPIPDEAPAEIARRVAERLRPGDET